MLYEVITRLVVKIAGDFQKYWTNSFLDLVQEGNIGLIKAINKFEPSRGIKFSYYATFWIRAYILKYIMDNWRLVRITSYNVCYTKLLRIRKTLIPLDLLIIFIFY